MTGFGAVPPAGAVSSTDAVSLPRALDVALAAAAVAGRQIREAFGTSQAIAIATKSGPADLVTAVDRAVEADVVVLLQQRTPDIPVLGEEGGRRGPDSRYLWVLDPVDGTNNFANGLPLNCFCLALLDSGRPVVGIIADPHREETFTAIAGQGAWLESGGARQRLHVQDRGGIDDGGGSSALSGGATLLEVGGGWDFAHLHVVWERLVQAGSAIRVLGSAGLALAQLAAGRTTGLIFGRMQPWDIAAGMLLVEEAGGAVGGWDGPADVLAGSPIVGGANRDVLTQLQEMLAQDS